MITNRFGIALLIALGLGACGNLAAVGDFAKLGSTVTSSTAAVESYTEATRQSARMAPPETKTVRTEQARLAIEQTKIAALGMQTLSLYRGTLGELADGQLTNVKPSATSLAGSLKSLGALPAAMADPAGALLTLLLTAPLEGWRRNAVSNLIERANDDVQRLANGLADFAGESALQHDRNISQANVYYRDMAARSGDQAVRVMLDEWRVVHVAQFAKSRDQAQAAETALRKIALGHAELYKYRKSLSASDLKALLSQHAGDIIKAAKLLPLPLSAN